MLFRTRLAEILAEQNLKQADVCRKTRISTALMSNYMTGKASPSLDNAQLIAGALGITLDYLVGREQVESPLPKAKTELLADYDSLDKEGQSLLKTILNSLKVTHAKVKSANVVQKNNGETNFLATGGNNNYSIVAS